MSYGSKIFIVNVHRDEENAPIFADILAEFRMGCMGEHNGWTGLFTTKADFRIFAETGEEDTDVDMYGEPIRYGDPAKIIRWLEEREGTEHYRRIPALLAALKAINPEEWEELRVVHYGY